LKTLISVCYEGTLGDKSKYATSLEILMEHLKKHPSTLNYKIIQCETPSMMLKKEDTAV